MGGALTESTLLDLVSEDGSSGFMVRLARHVDERVAWLWLVIFRDGAVHGFIADDLDCPSTRTSTDGASAMYSVEVPPTHGHVASIVRVGTSVGLDGGSCEVDVRGHTGHHVPRGPGAVNMRVQATFTRRFASAGSNLAGRTESIVDVVAEVIVDGARVRMTGMGQFHEQIQDAPRFDTPFTYMSLRGSTAAIVALRGPRAGGAIHQSSIGTTAVSGFEVDPFEPDDPIRDRAFTLGTANSGDMAGGTVTPTVFYTIPLMDGHRPSSIVRGHLDGLPVSGFVNDWMP